MPPREGSGHLSTRTGATTKPLPDLPDPRPSSPVDQDAIDGSGLPRGLQPLAEYRSGSLRKRDEKTHYAASLVSADDQQIPDDTRVVLEYLITETGR